MLVVICAIRKMVECVFSKRELRLLDDLLPESNKQRRRASHARGGTKRFKRKDIDIEDMEELGAASNSSKYRKSRRNKGKNKKNDDFELQPERRHNRKAIMLQPRSRSPSLPPYPKKNFSKDITGRKTKDATESTLSVHSKKGSKKTEGMKKSSRGAFDQSSPHNSIHLKKRRGSSPRKMPKCCIYVKLSSHKVYTPLHLEEKTVSTLLTNLETKFGKEEFDASKIDKIYQMNKKKFVFHLDDDMMEYVQSHEVFDIELAEVVSEEDSTTKFNMTMIEME